MKYFASPGICFSGKVLASPEPEKCNYLFAHWFEVCHHIFMVNMFLSFSAKCFP